MKDGWVPTHPNPVRPVQAASRDEAALALLLVADVRPTLQHLWCLKNLKPDQAFHYECIPQHVFLYAF